MNRWKTFAVGLVVGGLISGTAWAAIPDAGGVIHGCYNTKDGNLRVVDTEAGPTCEKGESPLFWNQIGPQGPAGPQGEPGAAGAGVIGAYGFSGEVSTNPHVIEIRDQEYLDLFNGIWCPSDFLGNGRTRVDRTPNLVLLFG